MRPKDHSASDDRETLFFQKGKLLMVYLSIVIIGLLAYSMSFLTFLNDPFLGYSLLTLNLIYLFVLVYLLVTWNIETAIIIGLSNTILTFLLLLFTGGFNGTGIYWPISFPLIALSLKGRQRGLVWSLFFLAILVILLILQVFGFVSLYYNSFALSHLALSSLFILLLLYFYQSTIELQLKMISGGKKDLEVTNQELQGRIEGHIQTIEQLEKYHTELETSRQKRLEPMHALKANKTQIEQEEIKNDVMLTSIGDGMIATDREGNILLVNQAAEEIFGWAKEEVVGKRWGIDIPKAVDENGDPLPREKLAVPQAISTGKKNKPTQYYIERNDGRKVLIAPTASPIIVGGKVIGVIMIFRDVTKEKEIDRAKSEFVSLASHQLRTPLSAVRWYTELLMTEKGPKLSGEQQNHLREIYHGNQRMAALIDALLNVSRIETGTFAIEPIPLNIRDVAKNVLKELSPEVLRKKLTIKEHYDQHLPLISLDYRLVTIILQNLLSNAVKYTPERGKIQLKIGRDQDPAKKGEVVIEVLDSGYGIPKAEQAKVFTKFYRGSNIKKKEPDGTGLGLYIVKSVVQQAGGSIHLQSDEGKGTTLSVFFPLSGMKQKKGTKSLS